MARARASRARPVPGLARAFGVARALVLLALALVVLWPMARPAPVLAQVVTFQKSDKGADGGQVDASGALTPRKATTPPPPKKTAPEAGDATISYADWDEAAAKAEALVENPRSSTKRLESLRAELVKWREAFLGAQNANASRIKTIKDQITALGPAPAGDGAAEADEIKSRRRELDNQLSRAQAPVLAAEEAYRRSDGLIREIDRELRERQADALMKLWPSPLNPGNWPEAVVATRDLGFQLLDEVRFNWDDPRKRASFVQSLPLALLLVVVGLVLLRYGRAWIEGLVTRLRVQSSARWSNVWAFVASLGGLIVPIVGVVLLTSPLVASDIAGPLMTSLAEGMMELAGPIIVAGWLALRLFPAGHLPGPIPLAAERKVEARYLTVLIGVVLGTENLRAALVDARGYSEGALALLTFPGIVLTALLLMRLAQLLRHHMGGAEAEGTGQAAAQASGQWVFAFLAKAVMVICMLAPLAAAIGYIPLASLAVYSSARTLALVAIILILQDLVSEVYRAIVGGRGDEGHDGLVPVLLNFGLVILSLPAFALVWGVREDELFELLTRFREGIAIGSTRISPTSFLLFALVFTIGYVATRALQRALKGTILPRTSLDIGGQNAMVSGVGYLGLFLSALVAINAAGIDLSGLAIVAGALSVGIGFGLQTIVSNFVSGIILLVERPVSEGDWIEVGTTQGIVKSISVRSTRIQTFDRSDVIVPNSDLITGRVTNWTRFNMNGRLIVPVTVPFTSDSRKVEAILREIGQAQPMALHNPPPIVALMGFAGEAMNFELRVILRDVNQQLAVRSEINHQIARRFAEEGILFTSAHRDHLDRKAEAAAAEAAADLEEARRLEAVAALLAGKKPPRAAAKTQKAKPDSGPGDAPIETSG